MLFFSAIGGTPISSSVDENANSTSDDPTLTIDASNVTADATNVTAAVRPKRIACLRHEPEVRIESPETDVEYEDGSEDVGRQTDGAETLLSGKNVLQPGQNEYLSKLLTIFKQFKHSMFKFPRRYYEFKF